MKLHYSLVEIPLEGSLQQSFAKSDLLKSNWQKSLVSRGFARIASAN